MQQFYIIKTAVGTKETGSQFPQIQKAAPGYNFNDYNSIYKLDRCIGKFPDFVPNLDYFILHKSAKITDLVSISLISACGLLISERLKNIFIKFKLVPHRFYETRIKDYKGNMHTLFWMHIVSDFTDFIDYPNSNFFIYKNFFRDNGDIEIKSKNDFFENKEKLKSKDSSSTIWAKKIKFLTDFRMDYDLFEISTFNADYFISDRLKEELINKNISGINIEPANNLIF